VVYKKAVEGAKVLKQINIPWVVKRNFSSGVKVTAIGLHVTKVGLGGVGIVCSSCAASRRVRWQSKAFLCCCDRGYVKVCCVVYKPVELVTNAFTTVLL
jgi:hypothetical protein